MAQLTVDEIANHATRKEEYQTVITMVQNEIITKLEVIEPSSDKYSIYAAENHPNNIKHGIYIYVKQYDCDKRPLRLATIYFTKPSEKSIWPSNLESYYGNLIVAQDIAVLQKALTDEFQIEYLSKDPTCNPYVGCLENDTVMILLEYLGYAVPAMELVDGKLVPKT